MFTHTKKKKKKKKKTLGRVLAFPGAPVAQWVQRWPTDLAVVSSSLARGEDLFNRKRGSIAHSISLSSVHRPDMPKILLKRT